MRRTVAAIVRTKMPSDDEFQRWTQEISPAIREIQDHLNDGQYSGSFDHTTTNTAAFETIWTSDTMPANGLWAVEVKTRGIAADGSSAFYWTLANYKRASAGSPTIVGSVRTVAGDNEDVVGWDRQYSTSGNTLLFQVKGDATRVVSWTSRISVLEIVPG